MSDCASEKRQEGFTLLELLVTVTIIGILAAISTSVYQEYKERARVAATASDLRNFASGFWAYSTAYENFPNDTNLVLPPGMESFIAQNVWNQGPAIGGQYNWEGPNFYPYAGISIMNPPPNDVLMALDRQLDDGNLSQGRFRIVAANSRPTYIISE